MEGETETKQVNPKMEILDILKEAITLYLKNINFIIFTFLTSLPYFFLMLYFEILFQQILVDTPEIISTLPFYERYYDRFVIYLSADGIIDNTYNTPVKSFTTDYLPLLIQLGFIYTIPLHVLELFSSVLTMNLASKIRSQGSKFSLKQMFQNSIDISILKGTFTTSLYIFALSNILLIAFPWVVSNCYSLYSSFGGGYIFFAVICCIAIGKLLMVYLEWSAIWNMSIVVSVMDGIYGIGALRVSCFFSSGNQKRGLILMLVFFVIGLCLRLLSVYFGCYKGGYGIFLQIGVLIVVNTVKWVACVIYFCDCKERKMEKKVVDEEIGKAQLDSAS